MAKKKAAKKAVRRTAKQAVPKPKLVIEPEPAPIKVAAPATVSEAKVEAKTPGRDPRFPPAKNVLAEYETKTHHIFKLLDHSKISVAK